MYLDKIEFEYNKINQFSQRSELINKGKKIAIMGKSGSGKSTLLHYYRSIESQKGNVFLRKK